MASCRCMQTLGSGSNERTVSIPALGEALSAATVHQELPGGRMELLGHFNLRVYRGRAEACCSAQPLRAGQCLAWGGFLEGVLCLVELECWEHQEQGVPPGKQHLEQGACMGNRSSSSNGGLLPPEVQGMSPDPHSPLMSVVSSPVRRDCRQCCCNAVDSPGSGVRCFSAACLSPPS